MCTIYFTVRFQVLTAASMKTTSLCDIAPFSLFEVDRRSKVRSVSIVKVIVIEAVLTSETWDYYYDTTSSHIPEECPMF
jgi:hypothetical protein